MNVPIFQINLVIFETFRTYKNLEKRVILECDGETIPLPSLQGIVVLNISSFMGGTNFWGNAKEDNIFLPPSFDDGILEVREKRKKKIAFSCKKSIQVPPRLELGSLDSESRVLTITPWNPNVSANSKFQD